MKYKSLLCVIMIAGTACHKSSESAAADYSTITPTGSNPFTNSLMLPQNAVAAGKQIVFGGGSLPNGTISDSVFIFDAGTNQWSETATSAGHWLGGFTSVNNLVIFAGGDSGPGNLYAPDVDIYAPSTGKWTTAMLSQGRYGLAAAAAGSIAAFGGGQIGPITGATTVDLYDAKTGKWTTSALSVPRTRLAAPGAGTK